MNWLAIFMLISGIPRFKPLQCILKQSTLFTFFQSIHESYKRQDDFRLLLDTVYYIHFSLKCLHSFTLVCK